MYLIIDKNTQAILHMSNSFPGEEDKTPEALFPGFDSATMDFGKASGQCVPVRFGIENGVVVDLDAAEPEPEPDIAALREQKLKDFEDISLGQRRHLIPDHQLLNAAIGIYDEARVKSIRDTVQAFRLEYGRLEKAVVGAKTSLALDAIKPSFPTAIINPPHKPQ
jgi:hypothetical protein